MSRKRKPNEISALFKDAFTITFIHKPTMERDDQFYYVILDNDVRLRLKLFGTILVVDEVIPITLKYLPNTYDNLVNLFINQTKYTVLVSIIGNTSQLSNACMKVDAPIVEDTRFITIPIQVYERLKEYYKKDLKKCGFYLLSVSDKEEITTNTSTKHDVLVETDEEDDDILLEPIEIGVQPLMNRFLDMFRMDNEVVVKEADILHDVRLEVLGIKCRVQVNLDETELYISDMELGNDYRYTEAVEFYKRLTDFLDEVSNIYIDSVKSFELNQICEFLLFSQQKPKLGSSASWGSLGSYKVTRACFNK